MRASPSGGPEHRLVRGLTRPLSEELRQHDPDGPELGAALGHPS